MLTIEEWHGPFDKPRTMLTERDSSGNFLRRFDLTGMEWVEAKAEAFSVEPSLECIEKSWESKGIHIGEPPSLKVVE